MKNNRKKKAFTLTELLVVVIVIGILSAVVLPKFSKVIETRKTTEAEEMMAAVRTEQERRCSLDKNYTTDAAAVNLASLNTKNFNYTLKNTGIEAASTGKYGYTLKMPSYRDGRLCCDSAEQCAKLNKNYPLCSELTAKADYTSGAECSADEKPDNTPKTCEGSSTQACGCKNGGTQTRTCDTTTGTWSAWGACSIADSCECKGTQPASSQSCNTCGIQTRPITCDSATGEWVPGEWGACDKTAEECATDEDCCSLPASSYKFAKCIGEKYGYDSTEYTCAHGSAYQCAQSLGIGVMAGCATKGDKVIGDINIGSGVGSNLNEEWLSGNYKRWACDKNIPCKDSSKPKGSGSPCNGCGTRHAIYECDTSKGLWAWSSVGACDKTVEECNACANIGSTWEGKEESNCEIRYYKYACVESRYNEDKSYGVINKQFLKRELREGAECYDDVTKNGKSYWCDKSTCTLVERKNTGGGGGGGTGGTGSCTHYTDMYSGSMCTVCSGYGYCV